MKNHWIIKDLRMLGCHWFEYHLDDFCFVPPFTPSHGPSFNALKRVTFRLCGANVADIP